jgi:hypothetical protein
MTEVSTSKSKPAHIPDSAVHDFDFFCDCAYPAAPHNRIPELARTAPPVFWTPCNGGHLMFLSHGANFSASRDTFGSRFVTP